MTALDLRRLALTAGLLGLTLSTGTAHTTYANCRDADLIQSATKTFVAASHSHDPTAFARAISRYVDVNALALFALGPFRTELPPDRKTEYFAKTRAFMARFLADHAESFANSTLQIQSCDGGEIRSVGGGQKLVWRISGNRVYDVQVDGVWLVNEMRSKFVSVIREGHGDIERLFEFLDRNS